MILNPKKQYLPDWDHEALEPFKDAFFRLMFAHTAFERRVYDLAGVIANKPGFGEQFKDRWFTDDGPKEMGKLIRKREAQFPGGIPEVDGIVSCLTSAIPHCRVRNLLAHGHWWAMDPDRETIDVRSDVVRENEDQHQECGFSDIHAAADALEGLEMRLYRFQSALEERRL